MHQLIYVSEARSELGSEEVFRIIEQSSRNNPRANITGFLIFSGGRFLQLVEGPAEALDALVATVERDPRHHSFQVLARRPVHERSFPRWRMKRVGVGLDALDELRAGLTAEGRDSALPAEVVAFVQKHVARPLSPTGA